MDNRDADYFLELQTQTGWGRTLYGFARWCDPAPGSLTLDVGCGPGLLPAIFSRFGCVATGVDIDREMFSPTPLHPGVLVADGMRLPFMPQSFDLITATNLLFLLPDPLPLPMLVEIKRLLHPGGKLAMLNPSENLNVQAAMTFASEERLAGLAKSSLFTWARRAEENHRWSEDETRAIYAGAGIKCEACILKVGPGFGLFSWGRV